MELKSNWILVLVLLFIGGMGVGYFLSNILSPKPMKEKEPVYIIYENASKEYIYQNELYKEKIHNKFLVDSIYFTDIYPDSILPRELFEKARQLLSNDTLR